MRKILNDLRLLIPVLLTAAVIAIGSVAIIVTAGSPSSGGSSSASAPAGSAQPTTGGDIKVDIADFKFKPPSVTVQVGGTVTWANSDSALHTATLDGTFDTGNLEQGDSEQATFEEPGTYDYICDLHPFMKGTVVVQ